MMPLSTLRKPDRYGAREGGFTLTELLMYSILMIVVLGLAGSLFIRLITEQRDIKAYADANNNQQLLFEQLEVDLRNADWAEIDSGGDLLVVKTRVATSTSSSVGYCVGYYFNDADGTMHRTQTTTSSVTKSALDATTASALRSIANAWGTSTRKLGQIGTAPIFGPIDGSYDDPDAVQIAIRATVGTNHKPVDFKKSVSMRPQSGLGTGCR